MVADPGVLGQHPGPERGRRAVEDGKGAFAQRPDHAVDPLVEGRLGHQRSLARQLGTADTHGQVDRVDAGLERAVEVRGQALGAGVGSHQPAPGDIVQHSLAELERPPVPAAAVLVGVQPHRLAPARSVHVTATARSPSIAVSAQWCARSKTIPSVRHLGLDRLGRTTVQVTRCALPRPATIASRTRPWANRRPGAPSSRTSAARAASSSDVRQSATFLPVIAATRGTANRVPSSDAARSDAAQSAESARAADRSRRAQTSAPHPGGWTRRRAGGRARPRRTGCPL